MQLVNLLSLKLNKKAKYSGRYVTRTKQELFGDARHPRGWYSGNHVGHRRPSPQLHQHLFDLRRLHRIVHDHSGVTIKTHT
jgi:hypothetical protein